ncbi:MAG: protein-glutamate O-methyltransferase CheR [Gammaproteobacteria bacterium]|nr:protein-glutamate O-methyltransferase CheR [Gammaproteobacteria bacterium]
MQSLQQETAKVREFHFTEKDFLEIRQLVKTSTGINLGESKYNMVYGRLTKRLRALNLDNFGDYRAYLKKSGEQELIELTNAITTNLTAFFRENHHFERLATEILPEMLERNRQERRLRIWSAGCSTGEEPYSLAITLQESVPKGWGDIKILATDLDSNVINHASTGIYTNSRIEGIDDRRSKRWFEKVDHDHIQVSQQLRDMITFKQLNLFHNWPMSGPFDVLFCRNVVIYFDKPTQRELFDRYAEIIRPGGYLIIGHSENLFKTSERFENLGNTVYRRIS